MGFGRKRAVAWGYCSAPLWRWRSSYIAGGSSWVAGIFLRIGHRLFAEIRGSKHGRGGFAPPCCCGAGFGFVEAPDLEPVGTEFVVAEGFVVGFECFHHLVIGAGHVEDGFTVADGFGVEGEAGVATHELHDVARGVWPDAGEGDEELEDLVVCAGVL